MQIAVEPTKVEDISLILSRVSPAICNELTRMYPLMTLREILEEALRRADEANTVFIDGTAVAIMGVTVKSALSTVAIPWLIPTVDVAKYRKTLLPASKNWIKYLASKYPVLENVGSTNPQSSRWLRWLGFRIVQLENGYQIYRLETKHV